MRNRWARRFAIALTVNAAIQSYEFAVRFKIANSMLLITRLCNRMRWFIVVNMEHLSFQFYPHTAFGRLIFKIINSQIRSNLISKLFLRKGWKPDYIVSYQYHFIWFNYAIRPSSIYLVSCIREIGLKFSSNSLESDRFYRDSLYSNLDSTCFTNNNPLRGFLFVKVTS